MICNILSNIQKTKWGLWCKCSKMADEPGKEYFSSSLHPCFNFSVSLKSNVQKIFVQWTEWEATSRILFILLTYRLSLNVTALFWIKLFTLTINIKPIKRAESHSVMASQFLNLLTLNIPGKHILDALHFWTPERIYPHSSQDISHKDSCTPPAWWQVSFVRKDIIYRVCFV